MTRWFSDPSVEPPTHLVGGLDLAGAGLDWSAFVVAEGYDVLTGEKIPRHHVLTGEEWVEEKTERHFIVRLIRRWPRGTDPGDVLADLGQAVARPKLDGVQIRWDATGLGGGLKGLVKAMSYDGVFVSGQMKAITITAGESSQVPGGTPKQDLVGGLSRVVQEERFHIDPGLPDGEELRREALAYIAKPLESGRFKYEAAGSGHDDLVTALALAVFKPMRHPAWQVARSFFRTQILTGEVDKPSEVVWPSWRAGERL